MDRFQRVQASTTSMAAVPWLNYQQGQSRNKIAPQKITRRILTRRAYFNGATTRFIIQKISRSAACPIRLITLVLPQLVLRIPPKVASAQKDQWTRRDTTLSVSQQTPDWSKSFRSSRPRTLETTSNASLCRSILTTWQIRAFHLKKVRCKLAKFSMPLEKVQILNSTWSTEAL